MSNNNLAKLMDLHEKVIRLEKALELYEELFDKIQNFSTNNHIYNMCEEYKKEAGKYNV